MNSDLTYDNINTSVNELLGGANVAVEYTDTTLLEAVKTTTRTYNRYRPQRAVTSLDEASYGVERYTIDPHPQFNEVKTVASIPQAQMTGQVGDPFYVQNISNPSTSFGLGSYMESLSSMRDARKILNSELEWRFQYGTAGEKYLYVTVPQQTLVSYEYTWHIQPVYVDADDDEYGLKWVDGNDLDWFYAMVTNRIKFSVGNALRKFGGIIDPSGSPQPTHGDSLVQESIAELETLNLTIKQRKRPSILIIG